MYVLVSCVLSATYALAVEHPPPAVRRYSRSHGDAAAGGAGVGSLRLSVKPEFTEMRRGDTVTVRCRARGTGVKVEETPFITFYVSSTASLILFSVHVLKIETTFGHLEKRDIAASVVSAERSLVLDVYTLAWLNQNFQFLSDVVLHVMATVSSEAKLVRHRALDKSVFSRDRLAPLTASLVWSQRLGKKCAQHTLLTKSARDCPISSRMWRGMGRALRGYQRIRVEV